MGSSESLIYELLFCFQTFVVVVVVVVAAVVVVAVVVCLFVCLSSSILYYPLNSFTADNLFVCLSDCLLTLQHYK